MKALYLFLLFAILFERDFAQSAGPLNPSTIISQSFSGSDFSWNNTSNIISSNDSRSTASAVALLLSGTTDYLKATGFGFSINPQAGIAGITVQIEKSGSNIGGLATIEDFRVRLVKNNTITGDNKATGTNWTSSEGYETYGGSTDLWGTTWTVSDINAGNFGVAISAEVNGIIGLLPTARIDHIQITVHYNIILPVDLVSFKAEKTNAGVVLNWIATHSDDRPTFTIERSADALSWKEAGTVSGISSAVSINPYQFIDQNPLPVNYYRLKISGSSGYEKFSSVHKIELNKPGSFIISPNPAKNKITISDDAIAFPVRIKIYNVSGFVVGQEQLSNRSEEINITSLKAGIYYVAIEDHENKPHKKLVFIKSE